MRIRDRQLLKMIQYHNRKIALNQYQGLSGSKYDSDTLKVNFKTKLISKRKLIGNENEINKESQIQIF